MKCRWFRDHIRQVHMDFHMPEFPPLAIVNFHAQAFVDHLERGRVNMVALFAKCHFGNSFYNTRVGHKHAGLAQDFLRETATECRRRGIRTLAYYSLCVDKRSWDANPNWRFVDAAGQQSPENTFWGGLCMNTPYKDELVMPQLEEIARDYPVDGFWLDIPMVGREACFCPSCKRKWRHELDLELTPSLAPDILERLHMRTLEDYHREIRGLIARTNPELVVATNCVGWPWVSKALKELVEIGVWESQPHPGNYLGHSMAARTSRNEPHDTQVMSVRFYEGWGDLTLKPAAQMTTEFAAMIGNGAAAVSGDQVNVDGTLQPAVYEMFHQAFGFVQEREPVLRHAESVRHAVVLQGVPDERLPFDFALRHSPQVKEEQPWHGAHKLLVESHIQLDLAYNVLVDNLQAFPMVILPEPASYRESDYARLREYVSAGGTLVAVGNALLHGGRFELDDVFGLTFLGSLPFRSAHFVPAPAVRGACDDIPLQVRGASYKVALHGATELAALHFPMAEADGLARKEFRSEYSPAQPQRSPYPFATVHHYGAGQAVYVAAGVFSIYWKTNHHWLRQFMEALLRHVDPTMPYEIAAAATIEANLMRSGDDLLLNLIHYALGHQGGQSAISAIEQVHPVRDIPCRVRCARVEQVVLEPEGREIPFEFTDGVCVFTVPETQYLSIARLVGAGSVG